VPVLLHMQGFGRVRVNAALTSTAAVVEVLGSAAALRWQQQHQPAGPNSNSNETSDGGGGSSLVALGCVTAVCQGLLAAASLACIVALPPAEARGRVSLLRQVFGFSGSGVGSSGDGDLAAAGLQEPLLAGGCMNGEQQQQRQPGVSAAAPPPPRRGPLFDQATREFLRSAPACRWLGLGGGVPAAPKTLPHACGVFTPLC
jgi:hypothetical protein